MSDTQADLEFVSRYDALGPPNGCKGECEGTGLIPVPIRGIVPDYGKNDAVFALEDMRPILRVLWFLAEAKSPNKAGDDWHFVPCPDCRPDDPMVILARHFMGYER